MDNLMDEIFTQTCCYYTSGIEDSSPQCNLGGLVYLTGLALSISGGLGGGGYPAIRLIGLVSLRVYHYGTTGALIRAVVRELL